MTTPVVVLRGSSSSFDYLFSKLKGRWVTYSARHSFHFASNAREWILPWSIGKTFSWSVCRKFASRGICRQRPRLYSAFWALYYRPYRQDSKPKAYLQRLENAAVAANMLSVRRPAWPPCRCSRLEDGTATPLPAPPLSGPNRTRMENPRMAIGATHRYSMQKAKNSNLIGFGWNAWRVGRYVIDTAQCGVHRPWRVLLGRSMGVRVTTAGVDIPSRISRIQIRATIRKTVTPFWSTNCSNASSRGTVLYCYSVKGFGVVSTLIWLWE